jgi:hypothetical protein
VTSLWLVDPATLAPPPGGKRKIGRRPLIDLARLQRAIESGVIGDEDVVLATRDCVKDLGKFPWTIRDLLDCLSCARPYRMTGPHDFRGSEWCKDSHGRWVPCDAYALRYDEGQRCWSHSGLEVFLKFSITSDGELELIMISAHL